MTNARRFVALLVTPDRADVWRARLGACGITTSVVTFAGQAMTVLWHCTHANTLQTEHGAAACIGVARLSDKPMSAAQVLQDAQITQRLLGNWLLLRYDAREQRMTATLSSTGSQWLSYTEGPIDGAHLLSDDMPLLCALAARAKPLASNPDALISHMAFRRVAVGMTYVAGMRRLPSGFELSLDARNGGITAALRQVARMSNSAPELQHTKPADAAIRLFEDSAERVVGAHMRQPTGLLLSGGVDSTLIGSLMRTHMPADARIQSYSYAVRIPEFAEEARYAALSANRLRADHRYIEFDLAAYPGWLTRTIAACAAPISEEQMPCFLMLIDELARAHAQHTAPDTFLSGEGSDDLFGFANSKRYLQVAWTQRYAPWARGLIGLSGRALRRLYPDKSQVLHEMHDMLGHLSDRAAPRFPANDYGYTDWAVLERGFGSAALREAIALRIEAVARHWQIDRLPLVEYVHMFDFFNEMQQSETLTTALFAQRGLTLHSPFLDSQMVAAALSFAANIRYAAQGRAKWLPKLLIERRHQAEAARLPKQYGGFPTYLFGAMKNGALSEQLHAMARPAWLDAGTFAELLAQPNWLTWNVLTWHLFEAWLRHLAPAATDRDSHM
jgi:asparagine synthetase B (glutamine-hydrolysing)